MNGSSYSDSLTVGSNFSGGGHLLITGNNSTFNNPIGTRLLLDGGGTQLSGLGATTVPLYSAADIVGGEVDVTATTNFTNATALHLTAPYAGNLSNIWALYSDGNVNINGQIQITRGNPALGSVLTSDANGLASWQPLPAITPAWNLGGNAGTNPATNFIGTTDAQSLLFKANNIQAGLIDIFNTNAYFGLGGGMSNTTGNNNVGVGGNSMMNNLNGNYNAAVGAYSLYYNTSGNSNTAIGYSALFQNIDGSNNIGLGYSSLLNNKNGSYNIGIGTFALMLSDSALFNTVVGVQSATATTKGSENTVLGAYSLVLNQTGAANTAIGYDALYQTTGSYNVSLGAWSSNNQTSGAYNTAIGTQALNSNVDGTNNTAIGANANVGSSSLNYATAVGAGAVVNTSNSIVLGAFGTNIGIGTSSPSANLELDGSFKYIDGNQAAGYVLTSDANGNGTWQAQAGGTPGGANQSIQFNNNGSFGGDNFIVYNGAQMNLNLVDSYGGLHVMGRNGGEASIALQPDNIGNGNLGQWILGTNGSSMTNTNDFAIYNGGYGYQPFLIQAATNFVGIGTNNPQNQLSIDQGDLGLFNNHRMIVYSDNGNTTFGILGSQPGVTDIGITATSGWMRFGVASNSMFAFWTDGNALNTNSPQIVMAGGGIGFGTTSPSYPVDIETTINGAGIKINDGNQAAGYVLTSDANGVGTWQAPAGGGGSGWGLTGNAGTDPTVNFIGTTDNKALAFMAGNVSSGWLDNNQANVFFGGNAGGNSKSSIGEDVAIGYGALASNQSGNQTNAIGYQALNSNTTGFENDAFGAQALYSNTTGFHNFAGGHGALYNNISGVRNVGIGSQALYQNTFGRDNTAIGVESMLNNTTGSENVASGLQALQANTTGGDNDAFGNYSLYANISGSSNIAIGSNSLYQNRTGSNNIAIGYQALQGNFTGNNITILGTQANVLVDGLNNATAIGANAYVKISNGLVLGDTMNVNVGIGTAIPTAKLHIASTSNGAIKIVDGTQAAGYVLTSDANGVGTWQAPAAGGGAGWGLTGNAGTDPSVNFIGTTDDKGLTFGVNNNTIGFLDADNSNLTFGLYAGPRLGLGTGTNNSVFGNQALSEDQTGSFNTAIGNQALVYLSTGNYNAALGNGALYTNYTGSYNTAIGNNADVVTDGITNATAIGANAHVQTSNSMVLGDTTNVNVGIGTGAPTAKLHLNSSSNGAIRIVDGTQAAGYVLTSDANGVGTWQAPGVLPIKGSQLQLKNVNSDQTLTTSDYMVIISGTPTLSLPNSPVDGQCLWLVSTDGLANINTNGSSIWNSTSAASGTFAISSLGGIHSAQIVYSSTLSEWVLIGGH